ncbi:MAG: hypothetical protein R3A79_30080 [Nannocystaceae bacterium]
MRSRPLLHHLCCLGALLAVTACPPGGEDVTSDATDATATATATASSTSGVSASSTSGMSSTSASSSSSSSTSGTTTDDPTSTSLPATTEEPNCNFLGCDDAPREDPPCDTYMQDCPEGQKCTYNGFPGAHHCVDLPAAPKAPGEPCQAEGELFDGVDDCGVGGVCWFVDEGTGVGECVTFCTGSADLPTCDDPSTACIIGCQECVGMCIPTCDPLVNDCPEGDVCLFYSDETFQCVYHADEGPGGYLDVCEYQNACDPGLACIDAAYLPGCGGASCCAPFCDLNDPTCPDALTCYPALENPGPGVEHVGMCLGQAP